MRVFTIGTVSKSLAPTIRVGWVLGPPAFAEALAEEKLLADRGTPGCDQRALALLVESGRSTGTCVRMRVRYARRRAALVDALARHAPAVRLTGLAAGLPRRGPPAATGPTSRGSSPAAAGRGLGLYGMSGFRVDGATTPPQLVLGFGNLGDRAVAEGIATSPTSWPRDPARRRGESYVFDAAMPAVRTGGHGAAASAGLQVEKPWNGGGMSRTGLQCCCDRRDATGRRTVTSAPGGTARARSRRAPGRALVSGRCP
jgi:hypothetical protein